MAGNEAVAALRKELKGYRKVDDGTVVKFTTRSGYTYAALFVAGYWWVTGESSRLDRKLAHNDFIEMLSRQDSVEVALGWETL